MMFSFRSLRVATTVMALATLAACSKKDDATPAPAPNPEGMSWTVDGNNVTATTAVSQAASGTLVTLAGATSSTGGVFLDVPKVVGTYPVTSTSDASASYVVTPSTGSSQFYDATTGTIVVSAVSATSISGTFTFTGAGTGAATKTLTNGKFNVKL
ncbi:DUF6252 family protein [Hymenobacter terricola]|uniref:DUF6252 family protein n=1 Tax=Hymenobacter terricola TaxID=2819236 RepID=UPI001B306A51|nr:DUF6252 family protein [Hymenobacter terricola]